MATINSWRPVRHLAWVVLVVLCVAVYAAGEPKHRSASFVIDLPQPYSKVKDAIRKIASDGVVRGTKEYQRDAELTGAQASQSASLFADWSGPGEAFYKVKTGALSPAHFVDSNDSGTVAVRYIIEAVGPATTRLPIDAVFEEDGHHRRHPSDGSVEAGEFAAVLKQFSPEEQPQQAVVSEIATEQKPAQTAESPATEPQRLAELSAELQQLQARVQSLEKELAGRSEAAAAPDLAAAGETVAPALIEPASPALDPEPTFQVLREQVQVFHGDWKELGGKQVLYVWVLRRGVNLGVPSEARWSFATHTFLDRYRQRNASRDVAGIVVIFLEPHGGVAAATMADIGQLASGRLSTVAFRNRCSLDPLPAFAAERGQQASYKQ